MDGKQEQQEVGKTAEATPPVKRVYQSEGWVIYDRPVFVGTVQIPTGPIPKGWSMDLSHIKWPERPRPVERQIGLNDLVASFVNAEIKVEESPVAETSETVSAVTEEANVQNEAPQQIAEVEIEKPAPVVNPQAPAGAMGYQPKASGYMLGRR